MDKNLQISTYNKWLNCKAMPKEFISELETMRDDHSKISEAFYKELEFGTSGLRGVMGPGTSKMNTFVVAKVTQGLANYINGLLNNSENKKSVVICYDSRHNSREFAEITAGVLSANDISAYIFENIMPVSLLSFAIRYLGCDYGVMITASHNSKEYNGYKVYNSTGAQLLDDETSAIFEETNKLDIFDDVKEPTCEHVTWLDDEIRVLFEEEIAKRAIEPKKKLKHLRVVYSPLNGTGKVPVLKTLERIGLRNIKLVPEQAEPDGCFTTCKKPNPEREEVYALGQEILRDQDYDILIVTDPDCDRIGLATKDRILTGNQLAALLFNYICMKKGKAAKGKTMIRSIVSSPLVDAIAKNYGVKIENTLIGFKYIGEKIEALGDNFIFGFEEGNGYLAFDHVRDKDGVSTAMLICEMAADLKMKGINIEKALKKIYKKYGYYGEKVVNYWFEGVSGDKKREALMEFFRENIDKMIKEHEIKEARDYLHQEKFIKNWGACEFIDLPVSNILEFYLDNVQRFIIRPSGTEPSIKAYFLMQGKHLRTLEKNMERIETKITEIVDKIKGEEN